MSNAITGRTAPALLGIAASAGGLAGAATYFLFDAPPTSALSIGVAAACAAALVAELRLRRAQAARLEDAILTLASRVERATAHLATLDDRTNGVEQWIAGEARPGVEQSAAEIEMLGTLVKELAVTVAHHDAELASSPQADPSPAPLAPPPVAAAPLAPVPARTFAAPVSPAPTPVAPIADPAGVDARRVGAAIDRAISDGEFELHLQPIVSLPQRRVKFYEAFPRLRDASGDLAPLEPALALANSTGRRPAFDVAALRRVGVATRKLIGRNRDIAVFLRLSDRTLTDMESLTSALHGMQDLAGHIVIVLTQTSVRLMGSIGMKKLKPILDLGFTFGMDGVADLRLDPRMLFDHGVRYVKAPAAALLSDARRAPSEIQAQDLSRLLTRNGIQLIAQEIDLEKTVIEALDLDIRFGQGAAFSAPRPVRPDLLDATPAQKPVTPSEPAANDAPTTEAAPQRTPYRSTLRRA